MPSNFFDFDSVTRYFKNRHFVSQKLPNCILKTTCKSISNVSEYNTVIYVRQSMAYHITQFYTVKNDLRVKLRQFLKKNISCNFVNQRHHGASVKTPGGFVDILNPFTLKNLESYTVFWSTVHGTAGTLNPDFGYPFLQCL